MAMYTWICILIFMTAIAQGFCEYPLKHYTLDAKQAKAFLHLHEKRSDPRCNRDEHYCEFYKEFCMHANEDSREHNCNIRNNCFSGQTCHLTTPCPCHFQTGCSDCRPGPADVVFVLDSSHSVNASFEQSKAFVSDIVSSLPVGHNDFLFALVTYSSNAIVEFPLNLHGTNASLLTSIANARKHSPGVTNTSSALQAAHGILSNSSRNAYRHIILMSDGLSTDRAAAIQNALTYRYNGYRIYTVGVGNDIDQQELLAIASKSYDFGGIPYVFSWKQIEDLRNVLMSQTIHVNCSKCSVNSDAEVILMLDTTMQKDNFELARDTMMEVFGYLNIKNTGVKIGLTSFGRQLKSEFLLNRTKCCDICTLVPCIQRIEPLPDQTANITNALETVSQTFSADEKSFRKYLIIFSNGTWHEPQRIKETIQDLYVQNISIMTVAIGKKADLVTIESVTLDSNFVFFVKDKSKISHLKTLKSSIFRVQCRDDMFA